MVLDTPHELAAFREYQGCLDDNPREIKRAVNIHRLMKLMMQKHGLSGGGWTIQRQRQLVRWVLFCTCWPELVGHSLRLAGQGDSDEDVLKRCTDEHASVVKDPQRRERLTAIVAQDGDELPPETIDTVLKFVARSSLLVEEPELDVDEAEGVETMPRLRATAQGQKGD